MDKLFTFACLGAFGTEASFGEVEKIAYILPVLIILAVAAAVKNKAPVYRLFLEGAEDGFKMLISVLPPMIAVLSMAAVMKSSGLLDFFTVLIAPVTQKLGIPSELLPLAVLRPFSGGGALGLLTDTVKRYGADSPTARAACILCASTETTFYTVSVYFKNTAVKRTKNVILAAAIGDLVGILCASYLK